MQQEEEFDDQLGSAIDTIIKLHDKSRSIRDKLLMNVARGQGLSHEQLVEVYEEIDRLFPRRTRRPSTEPVDSPL